MDPLEITQLLRGKIYTFIDILLTTSIPNVNNSVLNEIMEMVYDFLDLAIIFLNFYKNKMFLLDYLDKYPDIFLVDENCAVLACLYEVIHTVRRIFGFDERVNFFYKVSVLWLKVKIRFMVRQSEN